MAPRVCDALRNNKPTDLDVELSGGSAVLTWDAPGYDADSLTGYRILRGVDGATPVVRVTDTGSTDTTWTDGSPAAGEYVYVVKAIYDDYYASQESEQAAKTVAVFPGAVRNLSAVVASGQVTLTWDAPEGSAPVTGYRISRGGDEQSLQALVADTGSTTTTYVDATVTAGETYVYGVAALNGEAGGQETTVTAEAEPPLAAAFEGMPEVHDGATPFTFELRFSEEFTISYRTLRDHAFTVTNGRVTGARRLVQGSNLRWEITVLPGSTADVVIALPATEDCAASGAICASDDRGLSNRTEATVPGPPSTDATLSGLTLSGVDFGTFNAATTDYTASVDHDVGETTVTPTTNDDGATYAIKLGGVTDADGTVSLSVGSNVITVDVTAEDGNASKTYTVTVTRAAPPSTDAALGGLSLSGVDFGTFNAATTDYTASVANDVTETTVSPDDERWRGRLHGQAGRRGRRRRERRARRGKQRHHRGGDRRGRQHGQDLYGNGNSRGSADSQ